MLQIKCPFGEHDLLVFSQKGLSSAWEYTCGKCSEENNIGTVLLSYSKDKLIRYSIRGFHNKIYYKIYVELSNSNSLPPVEVYYGQDYNIQLNELDIIKPQDAEKYIERLMKLKSFI